MKGNSTKIRTIIRRHKGVSIVDLCALLGITPSYLSLLRANKRTPSRVVIARIQRMIDDPAGLLDDWSGDMRRKLK